MKTNGLLRGLELSAFERLAIVVAAALLTQLVHAQGPPLNIVLEELSPTILNVTYDGTDITATAVNNTSPDHWTVTLPDTAIIDDHFPEVGWVEPENFGPPVFPENTVTFPITNANPRTNQMFVASDVHGISSIGNFNPDEGMSVVLGTVGLRPLFLTFDDDAATAEASVPDTGSSFGLLSLALTVLTMCKGTSFSSVSLTRKS